MNNKPRKTVFMLAAVLLVSMTAWVVPDDAEARRGGGGKGQTRTKVHSGNKNRNVNRKSDRKRNSNRNVNINRNTNVNVNVDRGYRRGYNPIATGVAIGAAAAVTAAVVGSIVYSLPPSCTTVIVNGSSYQQCGSTWYQPRYAGSDVTYVVVNSPH